MAGWWLAGLLGFDGFPPFRKGETWVFNVIKFRGVGRGDRGRGGWMVLYCTVRRESSCVDWVDCR